MDSNSYKTLSAKRETVEKKWLVIDAEGKTLGRLSSEIARLLRGKHKTSFTSHVDCGDNIIVINAEKVRLTGNKENQKVYLRHTGYPGGQREATIRQLRQHHPERIIEHAVKGMLPHTKLGRQQFTNLRVYAGTEHPHAAQEPETYEI